MMTILLKVSKFSASFIPIFPKSLDFLVKKFPIAQFCNFPKMARKRPGKWGLPALGVMKTGYKVGQVPLVVSLSLAQAGFVRVGVLQCSGVNLVHNPSVTCPATRIAQSVEHWPWKQGVPGLSSGWLLVLSDPVTSAAHIIWPQRRDEDNCRMTALVSMRHEKVRILNPLILGSYLLP